MIAAKLSEMLLSMGAALVGVGDLALMERERRGDLPLGLSIAIALDPVIVAGIRLGPTARYYAECTRTNQQLDILRTYAIEVLTNEGYVARAQPTVNLNTDPVIPPLPIPHRLVATRAGLGWIGKCNLLVTESYGSAIRLTTVLTDAPLPAATPVLESLCGECMACVERCPHGAPSGRNWRAGPDGRGFFDEDACRRVARTVSAREGIPETLCGMCIATCPFTLRYLGRTCPSSPDETAP